MPTDSGSLPEPTDITDEIYNVCKQLFSELWDGKTPLRLLGVALSDLTRDETSQLSIFGDESEARERARRRDKAVDAIRKSFGSETIVRGAAYRSDINVGRKYKAQMEDKD